MLLIISGKIIPFLFGRLWSPYFLFFYFSIPFIILALLSPSLPVVLAQIRGHITGPSSPLPTTVHAFIFMIYIVRRNQHFSSLVDLRPNVPTHTARHSQQLIIFSHYCKYIPNLTTVGIELKDQR